jgi:hypothetical protein
MGLKKISWRSAMAGASCFYEENLSFALSYREIHPDLLADLTGDGLPPRGTSASKRATLVNRNRMCENKRNIISFHRKPGVHTDSFIGAVAGDHDDRIWFNSLYVHAKTALGFHGDSRLNSVSRLRL